ncbi:interferon-induced protein 44-like isoform X2 [Alosa alosa]|uniref:interferon-induced protein 44-like isoform X2 n=1 Tax=Alosa alosa TaxID=278164 RepID=UPI0020154E4E|nr:interferon-induced protein 44-like isoform X2 [Alosa alosa]
MRGMTSLHTRSTTWMKLKMENLCSKRPAYRYMHLEKMGVVWSYFFPNPSPPPDPVPLLMETAWYNMIWNKNQALKGKLSTLHPKHPAVQHLRILVSGPIGAGKSSFIYSIDSILQNKKLNAAERVTTGNFSGTKTFTTSKFKDEKGHPLSFVIGDVMGLESADDSGVKTKDLVSILKGHIKDNYKFNPISACSGEDIRYNSCPTLNDKAHCLVLVIPADSFTASGHEAEKTNVLLDTDSIKKIQNIRRKALDLRIPHVVILTKVDLACPHVKEDIKHVYSSRTIHQKMQACSNALGIPTSDIFPVSNYHGDNEPGKNPDKDAVLLSTLTQILDYANDSLEKMKESEDAEDGFAMGPRRRRSMESNPDFAESDTKQ